MAYIRMGQDSQYVDLHGGSRAYIYNHGSGIEGFGSYGEFIDSLCIHAEQAGFEDAFVTTFEEALEDHYGEARQVDREEDYKTVGPKAEMAHIIAQHVDSRLESLELRDSDREQLRAYAEESFVDCPSCGETHRPDVYTPDEQGDLCQECYVEQLKQMDLSVDVSALREYVDDELPERVPPDDFHDDDFYSLVMEKYLSREGAEREALHHILAENAADEVSDAIDEERPVNKEKIHDALDGVEE